MNLSTVVFITNVKEGVSQVHTYKSGWGVWEGGKKRLVANRSTGISQGKVCTYLHATSISPSHPLVEPRPPIFDEVLLGVLDPVAVPEPALGPGGRQRARAVQVHLEVLLALLRDHIFRAPGAAALVLSQPGKPRNYGKNYYDSHAVQEYSRARAYSTLTCESRASRAHIQRVKLRDCRFISLIRRGM